MEYTTTLVAGLFEAKRSNPLNNPEIALNLQDPDTWEKVFGSDSNTDSGVNVTAQKALMCPPFWQAIALISGDIGATAFAPYRRKTDARRSYWLEDENHWTYSLVAIQANDYEPAGEYWERLTAEALLWGKSFGLIWRDASGRPSELLRLLPDRTDEEIVSGVPYVVSEINGKLETFAPEDVIVIRNINPLGVEIAPFYRMARETIGTALAANSFTAKFFKNGARVGGILELPANMPKPIMQQTEEGFRKNYDGGEAFKTVILRDGAKFHQAQVSPKDVQIVETSERQARDIARFFNVPPSMLGIEGSSSYNSKAEDSTGYTTHCLRRWMGNIAGQCRLKLLAQRDRAGICYRHNTDDLFRMDLDSRMRAYSTGIAAKILSPNDAATEEGYPPHDGGDEYANPNTSSPNAAASQPVETVPDEPARSMWPAAAVRDLFRMTMAARHKAKNPRAYDEWTQTAKTDDAKLAAVVGQLVEVVNTATPAELPARVDVICAHWENKATGDGD